MCAVFNNFNLSLFYLLFIFYLLIYCFIECYEHPSVTIEWLASLICIQEVPGSDLGSETSYSD